MSEVQSTSFMKGKEGVESALAAASIALSFAAGTEGAPTAAGVIGFAFTTSLNSKKAAYAAFASPALTLDIRYGATVFVGTSLSNALYTSIVTDSGTLATSLPSAALT